LAKSRLRALSPEQRIKRQAAAQATGLYADSLLDELAARKLRLHHPDLARRWDALQQQQRKTALQKHQSTQSIELDLDRTRFLSFC
jgi:hypothetical protein